MLEQGKFSIEKKRVADSFSLAAKTYDEFAVLQREVADKLLSNLSVSTRVSRILDLGSGTGYCTKKLRVLFPKAEIVSLDIAEGMLHFANLDGSGVCADAEALPFTDGSFDLVVSSLAIQWCQNYSTLFLELYRVLGKQGEIRLSTFGPKTLEELKLAWKEVDDYVHVNQFFEKENLKLLLREIPFSYKRIDSKSSLRYYPSLKALSKELKSIGAHNMNKGQEKGLGQRQKLEAVKKNFEKKRLPQVGIPVTYELYYLYLGKDG